MNNQEMKDAAEYIRAVQSSMGKPLHESSIGTDCVQFDRHLSLEEIEQLKEQYPHLRGDGEL